MATREHVIVYAYRRFHM